MSTLNFHEQMSKKHHSDSALRSYHRKQKKFKAWLVEKHPKQCQSKGSFTLKNVSKDILHTFMSEVSVWKENESPKHKAGTIKGVSVPEGYHAAIANVYKQLKTKLPDEYVVTMKTKLPDETINNTTSSAAVTTRSINEALVNQSNKDDIPSFQ